MKYTLLDLTQTIMSSLDSDEINSINDTTESQQVVKIIRTVYYDILARSDLPEHYDLVSLEASGLSTKPVLMTLPTDVDKVLWIKYDKATTEDPDINMQLVEYLPLEMFLDRMHGLDVDETTVDTFTHTVGSSTFTILYYNDRAPQYYTTFDDNTIIFDSYDSDVDTTLQKSKTLAYAKKSIPFTLSDTFTPDLDEQQFSLLLNEAKALAWTELKQAQHPKAELNSKRGWTSLQRTKHATETLSDFDKLPYFGRK